MKETEIKVLKLEPKKAPEVVMLKNELRELQKAVSIGASDVGLIEIIELNSDVCVLCNEEGKLLGLEPNRTLGRDILCGVFYLTGQDYNQGNLASLPEHLIEYYSKQFAIPDDISKDEVDKALLTGFYVL
ncbi:MAG: DUF3846 domain-containing protein [Oscillospiraceae bacterium]|nr:DUF3846 domain-containing protein [Oscillospiraceae bacterium]